MIRALESSAAAIVVFKSLKFIALDEDLKSFFHSLQKEEELLSNKITKKITELL